MRTRCGEGEAVCPQSWSRDPFRWSPVPECRLSPGFFIQCGLLKGGLGSFVLDFFLLEGKTVASAFGKRGMGSSGSKLPFHKPRVLPPEGRAGMGDEALQESTGGNREAVSWSAKEDSGPAPQKVLGWVCGMQAPHSREIGFALPPCPLPGVGWHGRPQRPSPSASPPQPLAQSAGRLMPGSRLRVGPVAAGRKRGACDAIPGPDSFS